MECNDSDRSTTNEIDQFSEDWGSNFFIFLKVFIVLLNIEWWNATLISELYWLLTNTSSWHFKFSRFLLVISFLTFFKHIYRCQQFSKKILFNVLTIYFSQIFNWLKKSLFNIIIKFVTHKNLTLCANAHTAIRLWLSYTTWVLHRRCNSTYT